MSEELLLLNIQNCDEEIEVGSNEYGAKNEMDLYYGLYHHYLCNLAKYSYRIAEEIKDRMYESLEDVYYLYETDYPVCLISEDGGATFVGFVIYGKYEDYSEEMPENPEFFDKDFTAKGRSCPQTYIAELFIHPKHRRQGIATRVIKQILAESKTPVALEIFKKNIPAIEFWTKFMDKAGLVDVTSEYPPIDDPYDIETHIFDKK